MAPGSTVTTGFTIQITDGNLTPSNTATTVVTTAVASLTLTLANSSVAEFRPVGTAVGTLSSTESGSGHTFTYSLVTGTGSTDNASFRISGNHLLTADAFDFAARSSYSVRIRSTNETGQFVEQAYTITITNDPTFTRSGRVLTVTGTVFQDYFYFVAKAVRDSLSLNGIAYAVDTASISTIHYLTGGGPDVVSLYGLGGDSATLTPTTAQLVGAGGAYTVTATNCGDVNLFSSGSTSSATFTLGAGDVFIGRYDYSQTISANGSYDNNAIGFANTTGNAVAGSGSQAWMAVNPTGANTLTATTTAATISSSSYSSTANNFSLVAAYAPDNTSTANADQATLSTSTNAGDIVGGVPGYSFTKGTVSPGRTYTVYAVFFSKVTVNASANTVAYIATSSFSGDTYTGTPYASEVKGAGATPTYDITVQSCGRVQAYAGGSGQTATMKRRVNDPVTPHGASITENSGSGYDNFAIGFGTIVTAIVL